MLDRVSPAHRPAPVDLGRTLTRVAVASEVAAIRGPWDALLRRAPASAYQTPGWIEAWLATRGEAVRPVFGIGFDADDTPVLLLALGVERHGGLRVARFLGGADANTGLALVEPTLALEAADLRRCLAGIARGAGIDLYHLAAQPDQWMGVPNPLLRLPHTASPSFQHEADLAADPEAFLAGTLSRRARKHIRQKAARLAELGPVCHLTGETPALVSRIAAAAVRQRADRFGLRAEEASLRRFLEQAARPGADGPPPVELHALACGDALVATFAGALHGGHLSGMLISFADDPPYARSSPGELLLARVMARHCAAGTAHFDLGVGEARYKDGFCPRVVPLFDVVLGTGWRGRMAAMAWRVALRAKRRLKQTPWTWAVIVRMRRILLSLSRAADRRPSSDPAP